MNKVRCDDILNSAGEGAVLINDNELNVGSFIEPVDGFDYVRAELFELEDVHLHVALLE